MSDRTKESGSLVPKKRHPLAAWLKRFGTLRDEPSLLEGSLLGVAMIGLVFFVWWILTRGESDARILDPYTLPSIKETFSTFPSLWFERGLSISAMVSLGRVLAGFLIAAAIAVPLGLLAGSYFRIGAMLKPISIFGRNIPIAALIPLTLIWFGLGEVQKVMFIFLAAVTFVLFDTTSAARAVPDRFLETAYTLGAKRNWSKGLRLSCLVGLIYALIASLGWQFLQEQGSMNVVVEAIPGAPEPNPFLEAMATGKFWIRATIGFVLGFGLWFPILSHQTLRKVIMPMAMPDVVNSLRLLFGLAFGYIMLAEVINAKRGLGALINLSQRQGPREHIYLCLIAIALLAWAIDKLILWIQRQAFPHLKHGQD
ncbi:ABC transporter permease subunit [Luteolibacter ambystomatis]|uniref:ABC transporter permease subunit n=1 Tax=Luteolibacter ambystomatis TaxID=2824561 RepID=A0A975G8U4_9BACT|nr:ABC transporter permease subunit [Luteolibacter ambystomatis]QUE50425.1 ABC transporter permease subunit [Luteolibacter ambystomatis]